MLAAANSVPNRFQLLIPRSTTAAGEKPYLGFQLISLAIYTIVLWEPVRFLLTSYE